MAEMRSTPASFLWLLLAAGLLFGGLAYFMSKSEEAFLARAVGVDDPEPRPVAEVVLALRSMKLVTVEIDTSISLTRGDASWRGDVAASLQVPVRLHYGVDLSGMDAASVGIGPGTRVWVVRVPRPERVATEVFSERERPSVEVGWMRLRSRAGEFYLGQARKDAAEAARNLTLRPEDAARVEAMTRDQVEAMLRSLLGESAGVRVVFEDASDALP